MNSSMVNRNRFIEVYNKYAPNKFVQFMYNNFIINSSTMGMSQIIIVMIFTLLFISILLFKDNIDIIRPLSAIIFSFVGLFVTSNIIVIKYNNNRIKKIMHELNIDHDTYELLRKKYIE